MRVHLYAKMHGFEKI